jgi:hypothetical protein
MSGQMEDGSASVCRQPSLIVLGVKGTSGMTRQPSQDEITRGRKVKVTPGGVILSEFRIRLCGTVLRLSLISTGMDSEAPAGGWSRNMQSTRQTIGYQSADHPLSEIMRRHGVWQWEVKAPRLKRPRMGWLNSKGFDMPKSTQNRSGGRATHGIPKPDFLLEP